MANKGRPKGTKNRKWATEDKVKIVEKYLKGIDSRRSIAKEYQVSDGQLHNWIKKYLNEGPKGLESKTGKRGNSFSALHRSKDLPEIKRLQLEIAQLQIEVERLKKGYSVKGVGAEKVFVPTKDSNMK